MTTTSLSERFAAQVQYALDRFGPDPALVPMVLVRACLPAIPVDGAGLSTGSQLRIPFAASSPDVTSAERLQTTLGDGPCLTAAAQRQLVVADEAAIAQRWPMYHQELIERSPYRSTCSLPIGVPGHPTVAVLDLYSTDPQGEVFAEPEAIAEAVSVPTATILAGSLDSGVRSFNVPAWLETDPLEDRMTVWTAVGILMAHLQTTNDVALDILRGYAYRTETTLDQLAQHLVSRQLRPEEVLA